MQNLAASLPQPSIPTKKKRPTLQVPTTEFEAYARLKSKHSFARLNIQLQFPA
jgi:hypothetical protein